MGPLPTNTSSRDMTILTGWPVFSDSLAASGSRYTPPCPFPPNPPPISMGTTFTRETGSPSIREVWVSYAEMSLAAAPHGHVSVVPPVGRRGMRLNVPLVHGLRPIFTLNYNV